MAEKFNLVYLPKENKYYIGCIDDTLIEINSKDSAIKTLGYIANGIGALTSDLVEVALAVLKPVRFNLYMETKVD